MTKLILQIVKKLQKTTHNNQKPYSILRISGNPGCSTILIPLLIDLQWFSVKVWDFIDWVVIFLLVAEGKHYLTNGKDAINSLASRMNSKRLPDNKVPISQEIIDLLYSYSNYSETDQAGVCKITESQSGLKRVHTSNSNVLVTNVDDNSSFSFNTNASCAKYFSVSKVSVGRWINKNTPIVTKKGTFVLKKSQKR